MLGVVIAARAALNGRARTWGVRRRHVGIFVACACALAVATAGCASSSTGSSSASDLGPAGAHHGRPHAHTSLAAAAHKPAAPRRLPRQVPIGHVKPGHNQIPSTAPTGDALATEVNVVCAAVRRGAPAIVRGPITSTAVRRYAAGAAPPATRTVVSLTRLEGFGDKRRLAALAGAWQQLQAAYGAARLTARSAHGAHDAARQISSREQGVTALARSEGFPACAVIGAA